MIEGAKRMQLRISTDYAIRAIVCLGSENKIMSSAKVAEKTGMTVNYTIKIMKQLEKGGLVKCHRGIDGGYSLPIGIRDITLWDIVSLMETTTKINRCLEDDHYCSKQLTSACKIHVFYEGLQEEIEKLLKNINVEKILGGELGKVKIIQGKER